MKTQFGFIYVTANHLEEAKKLAKHCLDKKLVACVNIFPSMLSYYDWKNKRCKSTQVALILKTKEKHFKAIENTIKKIHSDQCPCICFLPISKGTKDFTQWMGEQIK